MLQQQSYSVISSKIDLLGQSIIVRDLHPENYRSTGLSSPVINEINPENLKVLKDGGTTFILSLCLLIVVLKDLLKELHQD